MGDLAIVVIWFASVIAGMVLTMLFPRIFAESPAKENRQREAVRTPSDGILPVEVFQGLRTSAVVIEEEA